MKAKRLLILRTPILTDRIKGFFSLASLFLLLLPTLALFPSARAFADTPSLNRPYQKSSPGDNVLLKMWPTDEIGESGRGHGQARSKDGSLLWEIKWYALSSKVIVLDDGTGLVRMGPWARRFNDLKDLAIAFYQKGVLQRKYQVADLVRERSRLIRTASHYFWLDQNYPTALSTDQLRFSAFTLDGRAHHFSTADGRRLEIGPETLAMEQARRLWVEGARLRSRGRIAEALEKLKQSQKIWPNLLSSPAIKMVMGELARQKAKHK